MPAIKHHYHYFDIVICNMFWLFCYQYYANLLCISVCCQLVTKFCGAKKYVNIVVDDCSFIKIG